jgi:hypothetical protein
MSEVELHLRYPVVSYVEEASNQRYSNERLLILSLCTDIMKTVYHCFSCSEDFTNIETAREHSKSLCHEVEEIQGTSKDGKSLMV